MHSENSIIMKAPLEKIFETAADLSLWPKILPHYRYVTYLDKSPTKNRVIMAAKRKGIPIKWVSIEEIDPGKKEVHFYHLKAFTRGMHVVWTFTQTNAGVEVRIVHDMEPNFPIVGRFIAKHIVGKFFIHYVANQTLMHMKRFVEHEYGS